MLGYKCFTVVACLAAASFSAQAGTDSRGCVSAKPTAESYTWNFSKEASGLLKTIGEQAVEARAHAAELQQFPMNSNVGWQMHAEELTQIRESVNAMGQALCRLETIRRVASPWEQRTIDRTAPLIASVAAGTTAAIHYLNGDHQKLWSPDYRRETDGLYGDLATLSKVVDEGVTYGKDLNQETRIAKDLGISAPSR